MSSERDRDEISRGRLIGVMTLLLAVNIFNFVDRQIPYILAESIKRDLSLSDTQFGVLGGLAFAAVYATLGLPLARLGERVGRKWVLSGSLMVWSGLTALGGFSQNFLQLLVTRLGVAAGEAGATPVAHSLISSYFPERRRGLALAIFALGVPLGTMFGLVAGGWINEHWTWREAMIAVGVPGMLLSIVAMLVLREPPTAAAAQASDMSMSEAMRFLMKRRSFRHMVAGIAVYSMGANAMIVFTPAFLMRTYDLSSQSTGLLLGLLYGVAGVGGTLIGGWAGDRFGGGNARWRLWIPAIAMLGAIPFTLGALFAPSGGLSVLLMSGIKFANLVYAGPVFVALHSLVPARSRATASAFLLFFNSLIGLSLGPLVTGWLSDTLQPQFGDFSLRYALCFVVVTQLWAAYHFWASSRHIERDAYRDAAALPGAAIPATTN